MGLLHSLVYCLVQEKGQFMPNLNSKALTYPLQNDDSALYLHHAPKYLHRGRPMHRQNYISHGLEGPFRAALPHRPESLGPGRGSEIGLEAAQLHSQRHHFIEDKSTRAANADHRSTVCGRESYWHEVVHVRSFWI